MKRKRNLLIVLLLVCTLAIGVGYAAYSQEMTVSGDLGVTQIANGKIWFTGAETKGTPTGSVVLGTVSGQTTQALSVSASGFQNVNDKLAVKVVIHNDNDFTVEITSVSVTDPAAANNTGTQLIDVTVTELDGLKIPAGQDKDFTVTFTCKATTPENVTTNPYQIKFTAVAADSTP